MTASLAFSAQLAPSPGEAFLVRVAQLLHRFGTPAHRLEALLARVATFLDLEAQVLVTPTSLFVAFGGQAQRVRLLRVAPGEADLGAVVEVDELLEQLEDGHIGLDAASLHLERIAAGRRRHPAWLQALAFAVVSAGAAVLFGGGLPELQAAAGIGLLTAALVPLLSRRREASVLTELVTAAAAAGAAAAWSAVAGPMSHDLVTLAALIVLLPGLALTLSLIDLATRHLVSGAARLADAGIVFLMIGLGVALGRGAATALGAPASVAAAVPLPEWCAWVAYALSPLAFAVLFQARWREVPWVMLATAAGVVAARLGAAAQGVELAAFAGALGVGLVAHGFARWRDRPASVPLLPGILMLVPGSVGYRALDLFLARDAVAGAQAVFEVAIVATALVGGLLVAGALLPPGRTL